MQIEQGGVSPFPKTLRSKGRASDEHQTKRVIYGRTQATADSSQADQGDLAAMPDQLPRAHPRGLVMPEGSRLLGVEGQKTRRSSVWIKVESLQLTPSGLRARFQHVDFPESSDLGCCGELTRHGPRTATWRGQRRVQQESA